MEKLSTTLIQSSKVIGIVLLSPAITAGCCSGTTSNKKDKVSYLADTATKSGARGAECRKQALSQHEGAGSALALGLSKARCIPKFWLLL